MNEHSPIGLWGAFIAWFARLALVRERETLSLPGPTTVDFIPTGSGFMRYPRSAPGEVVTWIRLKAGEPVRVRLVTDSRVTVWMLNLRGARRLALFQLSAIEAAPAAPPIPEVALASVAVSPITAPEAVRAPSLRPISPEWAIPTAPVEFRAPGVRVELFVPDSADDGLFIHSSAQRSET